MPPDNVIFSAGGRWRLYYWDQGVAHSHIRLEHAPTGRVMLDLTDDAIVVERYRFSDDGSLLNFQVRRADYRVSAMPITLDLATGIYYHHPIPSQGQPQGDAADLVESLKSAKPPPERNWKEFVPRWIAKEELGTPAPAPAPPRPAKAQKRTAPAILPQRHQSEDGEWKLEFVPGAARSGAEIEQVRIVHVPSGDCLLDLRGTDWNCRGEFIEGCNQVKVAMQDTLKKRTLNIKIDLDCELYWEEGGSATTGIQAGMLDELQDRYGLTEIAQKYLGLEINVRPSKGRAMTITAPQPDGSVAVLHATRARPDLVAELLAAAEAADLERDVLMVLRVAADVSEGKQTPEQGAAELKRWLSP